MTGPESIPRLHQTLLSSFSTTIPPMPSGGSREIDVPFPKGIKRYAIALMCFLIAVLLVSVRANMGVIISSFIVSKADRGQILSAIYYGALSTQFLGGVLSTKFGAKRVLLAGVTLWTTCDLSTLLLADNFTLLFIARICVGLGQGLTFPSAHQIAGTWYPMQERSRLVNFVASGMDIGVVVALLFSPLILHALKWQWVPIVFSMFAIVWVTCFSIFAASSPEQDKRITDEEREFILANRAGGTTNVTRAIDHIRSSKTQQHGVISNGSIPWKELFLSRAAWACYLSHFCKNFTWHVLLNWIPQYFRDVLKLNLAKNGVLAALPYLFGFLTTVVCGRISDYLVVTKKIRTLRVRRLMNSISYFGAAFFIFLLRYTTDPKLAVLLLTACLMFIRISVSGLTVNIVDIGGVRSGLVMGVSNTFGIMPGIIGNVITGQILEASNDWGLVFLIASLTLICGGLIFQFFSSDQCIFKDSIGEEQEQGQDQWEHREQSLHQRTIKTP